MATVRLLPADLEDLAVALLESSGVPAEAAGRVGEYLVRAELSGHGSHGLRLVGVYCDRCRSGRVDPTARPRVERDDGSTLILDGCQALGQVAGVYAARLVVERARLYGVAVVTMRRCGHLGRLADYVELAAAEGMIAILAANDSGANQVVAPHGSVEARLATNPIAIGIPRAGPPHFVLDMSTSIVSHGTVERLALECAPIPVGWTTGDALLPLGGAKGTGLALVVDVLAGILSGAGFSGGSAADDDQGLWIVALDPTRFLPAGQLERDVERLVGYVHSARASTLGNDVLVPGEPAALAAAAARRAGVGIPATLWGDLVARAREHAVPVPTPLIEEVA